MITNHITISQADRRYAYKVNFTVAVLICKRFLRLLNNVLQLDVEALIRKNTLPIRPERKRVRNIRKQAAVSFIYRVA